MKFQLLLSMLSIMGFGLNTLASEVDSFSEPQSGLHVYLLIGQSNMAGRAPLTESESETLERCYLLNHEGRWELIRHPLNRYSTIRKGIEMQRMNPGYSFAKTLLDREKDISIGLVVNAQGGTRIEQWKKGTHFYNEAIKRTKAAQETGTLKGILWHQGESDSGNHGAYLQALTQLVRDLRNDLGDDSLPFVAGQVYYHPENKPGTKQINAQIAKLPEVVPFTGVVSSEGLTAFDNTHFDSQGMKILGERYAEEMLRIQSKMESARKTF
jgi:hypothetical protein